MEIHKILYKINIMAYIDAWSTFIFKFSIISTPFKLLKSFETKTAVPFVSTYSLNDSIFFTRLRILEKKRTNLCQSEFHTELIYFLKVILTCLNLNYG